MQKKTKATHRTKRTSNVRRRQRKGTRRRGVYSMQGIFSSCRRRTLWVGALAVIALYIWAFYYFFVGPFGFRWRAIYGEPKYPDGYEIRGIDISHYQGDINWTLLQNAMIEKLSLIHI